MTEQQIDIYTQVGNTQIKFTILRGVLGLGGPCGIPFRRGLCALVGYAVFGGHRPHGPPCLLQITPFYSTLLLYPKSACQYNRFASKKLSHKSCRLQSGIAYTKTPAHIVRNLAVKLGIHGGAATCATKPPSSTQTLVVACATSSG